MAPKTLAELPDDVRRRMVQAHCRALCAWLESLAEDGRRPAPTLTVVLRRREVRAG